MTRNELSLLYERNSFLFENFTNFINNMKKKTLGIDEWENIKRKLIILPVYTFKNNMYKYQRKCFCSRILDKMCGSDSLVCDFDDIDDNLRKTLGYKNKLTNVLNKAYRIDSGGMSPHSSKITVYSESNRSNIKLSNAYSVRKSPLSHKFKSKVSDNIDNSISVDQRIKKNQIFPDIKDSI